MQARDLDIVRPPSRRDGNPHQRVATVVERTPDGWLLDHEHGRMVARQAASCLLEPAPGDVVLAVFSAGEASYVLAILEREHAQPSTLSLGSGDVVVSCPSGRLTLSAAQLELRSDELHFMARFGRLVLDEFTTTVSRARAQLGEATLVTRVLDCAAELFTQRSRRSVRSIAELDLVEANQIDYQATHIARIRGRHTIMTADELVKVDGDQIHVG